MLSRSESTESEVIGDLENWCALNVLWMAEEIEVKHGTTI
jgi:hypothetical protein